MINRDSDEGDDAHSSFMADADEREIDGVGFADPGGRSSLRAATEDNPRDCPCPNCGDPDVLTRIDRLRGYQCNRCADRAERGCE